MIALCAALIVITIYMVVRYFRLKNDDKDKVSLTEAYRKKDYPEYLAIINYKISQTNNVRDKNILATLKIQAYLPQKEWGKIEALYKQIDFKKLPKKIKLTFLCHYITALYLQGKNQKAQNFIQANSDFLAEAKNNSGYILYLESFKAFQAYADKEYDKAKEIFTKLRDAEINNDFYNDIFTQYLNKISNAAEKKETA